MTPLAETFRKEIVGRTNDFSKEPALVMKSLQLFENDSLNYLAHTKSSLGKAFKISDRVYDSLHIHVIQFRIDRQRQNLARNRLSHRQLVESDVPISVCRLQMYWRLIMNQSANVATAEIRLQSIPFRRSNHIKMEN